jgi:hypothetical protein
MSMLAELVDLVIGVDTHADTHTAALVAVDTRAVLATATVIADSDGYAELVTLADQYGALRAWAMAGSGGYGAGLARHLGARGELVVELDRPECPARRHGAKSMSSTPNAPPATPWPAPSWPHPRPDPSAPGCRCCSPRGAPPCKPPPTANGIMWVAYRQNQPLHWLGENIYVPTALATMLLAACWLRSQRNEAGNARDRSSAGAPLEPHRPRPCAR